MQTEAPYTEVLSDFLVLAGLLARRAALIAAIDAEIRQVRRRQMSRRRTLRAPRRAGLEIELTGGRGTDGPPLHPPVCFACGSCGTRPVVGGWRGGTLCLVCRMVPVVCDYCGEITYQDEARLIGNARAGRGLGARSNRVQCNRAGRKRCPRGPVMFALQLGREWEKAWIAGSAYAVAVSSYAYVHGFRVARELREDGYWMRRVG